MRRIKSPFVFRYSLSNLPSFRTACPKRSTRILNWRAASNSIKPSQVLTLNVQCWLHAMVFNFLTIVYPFWIPYSSLPSWLQPAQKPTDALFQFFFFLWQAISLQAQHVISLWFRCECSFAGHDFGVAFRFVTRARARRRPPPVITKFKALGLGIAVGSFQKTVSGIDLGKVLTILVGGLEVWNMNFIFPYIGNHNPNWLSYFSEGCSKFYVRR